MAPASTTRSASSNVRRAGFTLFEILLVMALLVVIAAVTMPVIADSLSRARLENGAELVRAAWGRARLSAMESGEPYVFRYEPEGSRYQIVLLSELTGENASEVNALPAEEEEDEEYAEADMLILAKARLPQDIVFAKGQVAAVPQLAGAAASQEGGWSPPITFYADGTTTDAVVEIANPDYEAIRVTLRGLTGISRASQVGEEAKR
jgi:prepilin-type N-terminal cleavage/methylation domain-containing protein